MAAALLRAVCAGVLVCLAGCAGAPLAQRQPPANPSQPLPHYSGPVAAIALADIEVAAPKAPSDIGPGLREMISTALLNSGRFRLVENYPGQSKPADVVVFISVSEFQPQVSGGSAGIGGGGGVSSGVLGGLLGETLNRAQIALDVRVTDALSQAVLTLTRAQGQASDAAGGFMAGLFGGWPLGSGLGAYANTSMEKALRLCIIEAVRLISEAVPSKYYLY